MTVSGGNAVTEFGL